MAKSRKTMKTTLTVEVQYNPRKTDPEALACAMDRLLETALSIPEVMDEYGKPTIGEFFVAKETVATPAPKVVLNMGGGLVQEVFASDPAITVALVDWDTEGSDPSDDGIVEIPDERGGTQLAHVAERAVEPLEQLAGTETEAALKAAGLDLTQPAASDRTVARKIELPCYGITVTLARENGGEEPGSGSIVSDLREPTTAANRQYNAAIDGLESLILAHACAGVDVESRAYVEGVETAVDAIANHTNP
jgi:hypothetical protein